MKNQNGNVLLYILIAVALMAALAYAISGDSRGNQADRMEEVRSELFASEIIAHIRDAERVVFQMMQWGTDIDDLRFETPGHMNYSINTTNQVYHPSGGGLIPFHEKNDLFDSSGSRGFFFKNIMSFEWSPSSATDLVFSFVDLDSAICLEIGNRLFGQTAIYPLDPSTPNGIAQFSGTSTSEFQNSYCPDCVGKKGGCVSFGADNNAFYYIIAQR
jgi:hypothetical protein